MGRLSPVLYLLIVPARHTQNGQIFGACQIFGIRQNSLILVKLLQSIFLLTGALSKSSEHTNDHHHCPISVFILMTSKLEANMEIPSYDLCIIYTWGEGCRVGGVGR